MGIFLDCAFCLVVLSLKSVVVLMGSVNGYVSMICGMGDRCGEGVKASRCSVRSSSVNGGTRVIHSVVRKQNWIGL